jgi:hypothetical protein
MEPPSNSCPWPLILAYDRAADTFHSTVIGGVKMLVAFADLEHFGHWKGKAEPAVIDDAAKILPALRLMATAGGNKKLAVMYCDPPDKWRVVQFDLPGLIATLERADHTGRGSSEQ